MKTGFVPLGVPKGGAGGAMSFAKLNGKPAVSASTPSEKLEHQKICAPKVRLEKQGDRITRIVVECGCGQQIELDCVY
jgi:hypothetical protein